MRGRRHRTLLALSCPLQLGRLLLGSLLLGPLLLGAAAAHAQSGGPDLNQLALDWARGRYSAPLLCTFEGEPMRGMRRVLVTPGSVNVRPPVARLVFVELEVADARRCFTDFGTDVPNLRGTLQIRLPGPSRSDTAVRDFRNALKRNQGFEFRIVSGSLQIQAIGQPAAPARSLDFSGGEAELREVAPGSDASRLLAEFASPRKVHLRLATREGETLELDMFLSAPR